MTARMMKKARAAAYLDLSVRAFEREVARGTLPPPVKLGGADHWCVKALDKAMDALTGDSDAPDHIKRFEAKYGKAA